MPRFTTIPRPLLYAAAVLFSAAILIYTGVWMYYARWQPGADSLGITHGEPVHPGSFSIVQVREGGPAAQAGLRPGDRIRAINGQPVRNLDPYFNAVARGRADDRVEFTVERDGASAPLQISLILPRPAPPAPENTLAWLSRQLAQSFPLLFLLLLMYVLFSRVDDKHAWLLALLFAAFIAGPGYDRIRAVLHPELRTWIQGYGTLFAFLGPAFFYSFFATFPNTSPIERRARWLKWLVLAVCAVVAVPAAASLFFQGLYFPFYVQQGWMTAGQFKSLSQSVLLGFIVLGFVALISNAFEEKDRLARRRFRVILFGTLAGFGPEVVRLALSFAGVEAARGPAAQTVCLALLTLLPACMAYTVLKDRVMGIPLLLKSSVRYLLVRRGLDFALLALSVWLFWRFADYSRAAIDGWLASLRLRGGLPGEESGVAPWIFAMGAVVGAVLLQAHQRVRNRYIERVDRAFFRSAYDTRQIMQQLAESLPSAGGRVELAAMLEKQIIEALQPESLAIYLRANGHLQLDRFTPGPIPATLAELDPDAPVLQELARRGKPWEVPPEEALAPPDLPELSRLREHLAGNAPVAGRTDVLAQLVPLQPECLVPVLSRDRRLTGLLVLGQRLSEEPYSDEDEKLLASVATQAGIALENIHMAEEMAARREAEAKRANEMSIARDVQSKLFPQRMPPLATLDYAGSCDQARTIGGDYYDYLDLGKGRVGFALADISGKGIFAALLMANLQANLRSQYALALEDLGQLMRSVNKLFFESVTPGLYATMFMADYTDAGRRLRYVNCGHNPPLLLRASGACEKLEATATVVGIMDIWECTVGEVTLAPGDILVVYSDGVTEASSDDGVFFGDERLEHVVRQHAHLPAAQLTKAIADAVHLYSGKEQEDDLTLLVARARP